MESAQELAGDADAELRLRPAAAEVSMHPTSDTDDFLARPVGRYLRGSSFVAWMQTPARLGCSHFASLEASDCAAMERLFALPVHPALHERYDVLHDLERVEDLDRLTFDTFVRFVSQRMPDMIGRARRVALVRPGHLAGATYTGLVHDRLRECTNARLFDTRGDALDWLRVPAAERRALEQVLRPSSPSAPLLRELRGAITADFGDVALARLAATLGTSVRSLQRHLAQHGTSLTHEIEQARIEAATKLLLETDHKVSSIARAVGFQSSAAFVAMCRRVTSLTPRDIRRRHRVIR